MTVGLPHSPFRPCELTPLPPSLMTDEEKRVRITFVYDALYPETKGGVEKRVWEVARRLVESRRTGLCVRPNTDDFAGALQALLEDDLLRGTLGREASRPARSWTWDTTVDRTARLHEDMVA